MSATNTTTNYNLPIFLSSDKPAWLVDFNGAMTAIDAQMKANADAIATKSPILTFSDTSDIELDVTGTTVTAELASGVAGTISRAFTKPVAAPAGPQIPSVDTTNTQQLLNIGSGLKVDSGALKAIDMDLVEYIEKTSMDGDFSEITTGHTVQGTVRFAFNSDRSIGKIYGSVSSPASATTGQIKFYTGVSIPNISETIQISPSGITLCGANPVSDFGVNYIEIAGGSGKVYVYFSRYIANKATYAYLFPCIYFFKNFGDTPTP